MSGKNYIAANIARLRLDRQLTQEELARKAGLSRMALGNIERGTVVPRARTLTALGKALRVPVQRSRDACAASRDRAIPIPGTDPCSGTAPG